MRRRIAALAVALSALPVAAQMMVPVGVDLFGDDIVKPLTARGVLLANPARDPGTAILPGYPHTLLFQDGRQLHGTLTELSKDHVVWSRPDTEPAFRFNRGEIRRILFSPKVFTPLPEVFPNPKSPKTGKDVMATVKLPGGDWLFGDARAENGSAFSVALGKDVSLKFSHSAVAWIYFGQQPAPAFAFSGEAVGIEGWTFGNPAAAAEVKDGVLTLPANVWIGRDISPTDRFELDFEVPQDAPQTRLLLQPMRPTPNTYTTGTIELSFGKKDLTRLIFLNRFERQTSALPQDQLPSARVRYRVFYDLPGNRLVVMRNDATAGEWKLHEEGNPNADMIGGRPVGRLPKGICFDRGQGSAQLQLGSVRIQPWDGVLPQPGNPGEARMTSSGSTKRGKLETITEKEIGFGGEVMTRAEGALINLAQAPAALRKADALVSLGTSGELAAADLEVRDGRARGRTAAIPELDLPMDVLHAIGFPQRAPQAAENADLLVFRNGDSMRGRLISAGVGVKVRWQAANGQELGFNPEHLAGMRLGEREARETSAGATAELLNGDRVRGEVLELSAAELRLRHDALGERTLPRALLRTLYPGKKTVILDAGSDPESWLGLAKRGAADLFTVGQRNDNNHGRVFLDGVFLNPPISMSMTRMIDKLERYELRCDVTDAGGGEPYMTGSIAGSNGTPSLQLSVGQGRLRVYSYDMSGARGRAFQQDREVSFADKLPQARTRRELRMFVDTKVGTADFMVDGVHLMRFGQQKKERAPGIGARLVLSTYPMSGNVSVLSNVWVGPWNGDVPRSGELAQGANLNNGDIAPGAIGTLQDGIVTVGEGAEAIEVPMERITSIEFNGTPSAEKAAARIRLADGTVLNLQEYRWADGILRAKSAAFGDLEIPVKAIIELILSPAPARFPQLVTPQQLATKDAKNAPPKQP